MRKGGNITGRWLRLYAIVLALGMIGLGWFGWRQDLLSPPTALAAWLGLVNVVTLHAFGRDKATARRNERDGKPRERTPEAVLHSLALLGGTPAAWLGIFGLRHKSRKVTFLLPLLLITLAQIVAVGWYLAR